MTDPCFCIALRKATRRLTARYDEALLPFGINLAQFSLMRNLDREGEISLTELARITELDRSTIGRNIRVLERLALVATGPGKDQREALVGLTPEGRDLLARATPAWRLIQTEVARTLGPAQADALVTLLGTL